MELMKTWCIRLLFMFGLFLPVMGQLQAQLSPGDLSKAHAHLEGVSNCTKCHVLGDKVSNDKCLSCHKELKARVDKRKGYHVSREVKGKECASCHNEHHGRNFQVIRFDEKKFDHKLAGYELTGAHKKIDCRECHKPEFIADKELKKNKKTFLGMGTECLSCHTDYHQKTLANDCAKCHTNEAFKPATKFDHNKSDFKLVGKHIDVACIECHQKEVRNGKDFQKFSGIAFSNCSSCHTDPHKREILNDCKDCHIEQAFTQFKGMGNFEHQRTGFPLKGKHRSVDCAKCHKLNSGPLTVFKDRKGVPLNDCVQCHDDVHKGKFGTSCVDCHTEDSFRSKTTPDNFNHDLTDFTLRGKHKVVDCRKCHTESLTAPLVHNACAACHTDYHNQEFAVNGKSPDCAQCHTEDGFQGSLFTVTEHNKTKFPLEGAHLATPCFSCHLKDKTWKFRNIGSRCVDCHDDVHAGQIPEKYYPGKTCESCHIPNNWKESQFNHDQTKFKLSGKHAEITCRECHVPDASFKYGKFTDKGTTCISCHEDGHDRQFEVEGQTDCARCHDFMAWKIPDFNHDNTAFKLDGKHVTVACAECHKAELRNGKQVVIYKIKRFECIDCHK